ncbi:hypothetical protein S7711_09990 [Stachybotrys chartarum IBT 7711]|uniref:Uncharacterized protein n=1 Tax=Stachybotrys chartarum (strain CBS 109288 / IBT 7711) TaxID=1280523 RepID=A0A084B779_STACB|nr:hypothetical protein S7711_09990 [Stachybotrys chartarum IBT 7711]
MKRQLDTIKRCRRAAELDDYDVQQQQIIYLTEQLQTQNRLLKRTGVPGMSGSNVSKSVTREYYGTLYHELDDASFSIFDIETNQDIPEAQDYLHESAQTWSLKVSCLNLRQLVSHCHAKDVPKEKLFQSMVTAAVFELVFETMFSDILALECPLLNAYRRIIHAKDGHEVLQQIDLTALEWIMSGDDFRENEIPQQSERLTKFIWQVLEFLHSGNLRETEDMLPQKFSGDKYLVAAISQAIDLKLKLMLSTTSVRYTFVKPGELFNPIYMCVLDGQFAGSAIRDNGLNKGLPVKLCLFPALYSRLIHDSGHTSTLHLSPGYEYVTEASSTDLAPLDLVFHAIVLLENRIAK